ncbi:MAG TPA: hypothetical protein VFN80_08900 [Acidothermaceae bacterium]|nr:hypothetical protein [Acidothermaceae bacterium]
MFTGLLIAERAAVRRSELLDDARTARRARRARAAADVVRDKAPCAPARRGWLRSATQPQGD